MIKIKKESVEMHGGGNEVFAELCMAVDVFAEKMGEPVEKTLNNIGRCLADYRKEVGDDGNNE